MRFDPPIVRLVAVAGLLAQELVGDDPGFSPGTLVEIAREGNGVARVLRRIGPRDVPAG